MFGIARQLDISSEIIAFLSLHLLPVVRLDGIFRIRRRNIKGIVVKTTVTYLQHFQSSLPCSRLPYKLSLAICFGMFVSLGSACAANINEGAVQSKVKLVAEARVATSNSPSTVKPVSASAITSSTHDFHVASLSQNNAENVVANADTTNNASVEIDIAASTNALRKAPLRGTKAAEIVTATVPGSPIPEPTTWAMLIIGLGMVTLRIRGMSDRSSKIH